MLENIYSLYEDISKQMEFDFPNKVRCEFFRWFNNQDNSFSVTLSIVIISLIDENEDRIEGIVFSTNAQTFSYDGNHIKYDDKRLFLMSSMDLESHQDSNCEWVNTQELIYYPFDWISVSEALEAVKTFILKQKENLNGLLETRYGLISDKNV